MQPDYFEAEIREAGYFTFLLPGFALGVESDTVLEISVDYGHTPDSGQIAANAWARERDGVVKGFLQTVHVDAGEDAPVRILEKLNGDELFSDNAARFIAMLDRQR